MTAPWRRTATTPAALAPEPDPVEELDYAALVALVADWRRSPDLAREAWAELQARRRVVTRLGWRPDDAVFFGPPTTPSLPPWWAPPLEAGPRVARWQRPTSSSCYLSQTDEARAAMAEAARQFWSNAAGVPREE